MKVCWLKQSTLVNLEWIIERTLINVINLFDFDICVSRKIFAVFSGCIFRHFDLKKKKRKYGELIKGQTKKIWTTIPFSFSIQIQTKMIHPPPQDANSSSAHYIHWTAFAYSLFSNHKYVQCSVHLKWYLIFPSAPWVCIVFNKAVNGALSAECRLLFFHLPHASDKWNKSHQQSHFYYFLLSFTMVHH